MHPKRQGTAFQSLLAIICIVGLLTGDTLAYVPPPQQPAAPSDRRNADVPKPGYSI